MFKARASCVKKCLIFLIIVLNSALFLSQNYVIMDSEDKYEKAFTPTFFKIRILGSYNNPRDNPYRISCYHDELAIGPISAPDARCQHPDAHIHYHQRH